MPTFVNHWNNRKTAPISLYFVRLSILDKRVFVYISTIFSCDPAALWMVQSVCLSVCHTFLTMFPSSYHHEIFRSYYQWQKWHPCKRSRSEVKGQGHRALKIDEFDPDWAFPDCNSSLNSPMATKWRTKLQVALKRCPIVFQGHPSNFKVTRL